MVVHAFTPGEAEQIRNIAAILGPSVFLYVGPDQLLPLFSALGAVIGLLLIIWHRVTALFRRVWHLFKKEQTTSK